MKPSVERMECLVANHFGIRNNIIIPNAYWSLFSHEMDIAVIRKSGYVVEVEIKRSVADFKNDFKKRHFDKKWGHVEYQKRVRQFYYCMTKEVFLKVHDLVPEKSGLLLVLTNNDGSFVLYEYKKANIIPNCVRLTDKEICNAARLSAMRIWGLKDKISQFKKTC